MSNLKYIIVHHSGGTDANPMQDSSNYTVAMCDADHNERFNMKSSLGHYCGYTYFIDKAGVVTQTRLDGEEGAHAKGYNSNSIGICLAGNFDATLPTVAQIKSLTELMKVKMSKFGILPENIIPHRNVASKTCYGMKLSEDWARKLVAVVTSVSPSKDEIKKQIIALVNQL